MPRQRKPKTATANGKLQRDSVCWAPKGSHPSQVSGMFQNDPTFAEFRNILHQQRKEDYRRANKAIDAMIRQGKKAKPCLSSTPTPSRTTKTRTPS